MAVSILHRVSGNALAVAGLAVLLWFVGAIAGGAASYETFQSVMGSPIGIIVLIGISWSFFNHLMSGIRHLVLDVGAGYEVERNNRWSVITILLGILLTALFWAVIILV
ncbi:succinate dehydrogenase, cytochrome b556 subunit [Croceicoccus mobilis]|uniref:Succinate dehydrogenase cytochrome b556 subunit n=2 Tax=Croceicoccus mobilis TaxID=1703339 RepID=A0A917DNX0_9SPHN|nr:succinate dehydrogenase, cytochrome b556 subunit [Croceicoccus mobilis]